MAFSPTAEEMRKLEDYADLDRNELRLKIAKQRHRNEAMYILSKDMEALSTLLDSHYSRSLTGKYVRPSKVAEILLHCAGRFPPMDMSPSLILSCATENFRSSRRDAIRELASKGDECGVEALFRLEYKQLLTRTFVFRILNAMQDTLLSLGYPSPVIILPNKVDYDLYFTEMVKVLPVNSAAIRRLRSAMWLEQFSSVKEIIASSENRTDDEKERETGIVKSISPPQNVFMPVQPFSMPPLNVPPPVVSLPPKGVAVRGFSPRNFSLSPEDMTPPHYRSPSVRSSSSSSQSTPPRRAVTSARDIETPDTLLQAKKKLQEIIHKGVPVIPEEKPSQENKAVPKIEVVDISTKVLMLLNKKGTTDTSVKTSATPAEEPIESRKFFTIIIHEPAPNFNASETLRSLVSANPALNTEKWQLEHVHFDLTSQKLTVSVDEKSAVDLAGMGYCAVYNATIAAFRLVSAEDVMNMATVFR